MIVASINNFILLWLYYKVHSPQKIYAFLASIPIFQIGFQVSF